MKTKQEILLENGYHILEGYLFEYERDNDSKEMRSILITKEEITTMLRHEPVKYFWNEHYEYVETLDEAWESFADNYLCDHDLELNDEELIKLFSSEVRLK